jgi:signal transduction histidine kinase
LIVLRDRNVERRMSRMKILVWFCWVVGMLAAMSGSALCQQSALDSMEQRLPTLTGKEKMNLAGELSYRYCFVNREKALQFGHMELNLALELGDSLAIAQSWNDLSAAHVTGGELKEAIYYGTLALGVRERHGDSMSVASTANRLGYAYHNMGVRDKAVEYFLRTIRIYEAEKNLPLLSMAYNNLGSVHLMQGNEEKALEYLEKAVIVGQQANHPASVIDGKTNIASIQFENGEYDKAEAGYREVLEMIKETGITPSLGTVLMNLGANHVRKGEFVEGIDLLSQADSIFEGRADAKGRAMTTVNLGLGHIGMREFAKARAYMEQARTFCEKVNSEQQWFLFYDGFYRLESAEGNVVEAIRYYTLANIHREKIYTEKASQQIAEMEARYETEKKQVALEKAALENRNQLLVIGGLVAVLFLGLVSVGFLVRNQKLKRDGLVQQGVMAMQEERLRISRDLHDNIGAELTLISSSAEEAGTEEDTEGAAVLRGISASARTAMGQLRETVWAIRSETIAVEAFANRVGDYARRLGGPVKMVPTVELRGDAGKVLRPAVTLQLYRMCQEAIHNAAKYSGSGTLDIVVEADAAGVSVTLTDKGMGFDLETAASGGGTSGYGLGNLRARAEESGGKAEVKSAKGNGTTVRIWLPC